MLHEGNWFPADEVARGAAYEMFADEPRPGFLPNPRPGARHRYRRFVHVTEVLAATGFGARQAAVVATGEQKLAEPLDRPLRMPVSRALDWAGLHRLSQQPAAANSAVAAIRRSATIRSGSRMVKVLSARQLVGYLHGWLPSGFCYREYDVAHLRTPAELGVLLGDGSEPDEVAFVLRWRAVDPCDYSVPLVDAYAGLVSIPPRDRLGPPVIGSGFAPASRHLIPEFVTADLADLPLTANASLAAFTPDGTEVTLYTYLAEQRGWTRMWGPQWRDLLLKLADAFPGDQEYFPVPPAPTRFVGRFRDGHYDAIADPPGEFRLAAKTRAARLPVESIARRTGYARWRDALCTIVRSEGGWVRVRPCRPCPETVARLGAQCIERGVFETWAPTSELVDAREIDIEYPL
ncbi:hypothetical protein [Planosporangium mesophilum]|uniref:Uncharacterized protein n=1 Tax=Planosporangium mesophilum TaxID=689768 RepID=A0A8J3T665_9ACTN|nr:hypothetical protein [Planosporangium mesophilum]GII21250.1 hypothetical protein Pme01_08470 [Planosporangium mesophilum]